MSEVVVVMCPPPSAAPHQTELLVLSVISSNMEDVAVTVPLLVQAANTRIMLTLQGGSVHLLPAYW